MPRKGEDLGRSRTSDNPRERGSQPLQPTLYTTNHEPCVAETDRGLKTSFYPENPFYLPAILACALHGGGGGRPGEISLPVFRLYDKATVTNLYDPGTKAANTDQSESPEINPSTKGQRLHDKGGKNMQWRKDRLLHQWCWENRTGTCQGMQLEHSLTPYTEINSKRLDHPHVRPDTRNPLEHNRQNALGHTSQQDLV